MFHGRYSGSVVSRCTVCGHPRLTWINEQLAGHVRILPLARELGVHRHALVRHQQNHLPSEMQRSDDEAKGEFLGAFKTSGDFKGSAEMAGVSRGRVQEWLEHDEAFSFRFNMAKAELVEHLEVTAVERATVGGKFVRKIYRGGHLYEETHEWRPSDAALIKLLSSLKPEVYGEKISVTQTSIVKAVDMNAWAEV